MKKFLAILSFILLLFVCVGCENTETKIDVSGVTFESTTVEYSEGKIHSIEVDNLPEGARVVYLGNGVKEEGTHKVTAIIMDHDGNELSRLEANIVVVDNNPTQPETNNPDDNPTENPGDDQTPDAGNAEYVMVVNGVPYDLNVNASATLLQNQTGEYMYIGVELYANDIVEFYHNQELITQIGPEGEANLALTDVAGQMKVKSDNNDAQVYFKTWADGGHSAYITFSTNGGGNTGDNTGGNTGGDSNGKTVTLVAGPWDKDGAWFAVYWWNGANNGWVKVNADGTATIPSEATNVIFTRMSNTSSVLDWSNKWNQTKDLTIDGSKYTVTGWGESDGYWS